MSAPTPTSLEPEAADFLAAVGEELADLPAGERAALLEDLAQHLEALAEEGDDRPVLIRLGSPEAYAEELRSAAGLPARGVARPPERLAVLRRQLARYRAHPLAGEVLRLWAELRPAWWVLRGYLLIAVPCAATGSWDFPFPAALGSHVLGFLLVVAAVAGSVTLGRRELSGRAGRLVVAGGVLLAVLGFALAASDPSGPAYADYAVPSAGEATDAYPLVSRDGPVTDVCPYAADGTPLTGVLLYDQDGRPLHVGVQQWWADGCARVLRQPLAADGVAVPNVFPQTYALDPADLSGGPDQAGGCMAAVERPEVPLPVFPSGSPAGPTG